MNIKLNLVFFIQNDFVFVSLVVFLLTRSRLASGLTLCFIETVKWQEYQNPLFTCTIKYGGLNESFECLLNCNRFEVLLVTKNMDFLPKQLGSTFPNLLMVKAKEIGLEQVRKETFNLPKLTDLNLDSNQIKVIEENAFQSLDHLEMLCLRSNKITKLDPSTFAGLKKLRVLHLNDNEIAVIDSLSFENLESLEHLDLSQNKISIFYYEKFSKMKNLKYLNLASNALSDPNSNASNQNSIITTKNNLFIEISSDLVIQTFDELSKLKNGIKIRDDNINVLKNFSDLCRKELEKIGKSYVVPKMFQYFLIYLTIDLACVVVLAFKYVV